jgi:hypothetical protein
MTHPSQATTTTTTTITHESQQQQQQQQPRDHPKGRFPIPMSLPDLEREPYNLLPYPYDFEDDDKNDTIRIRSFAKLLQYVEQGNRCLNNNNYNHHHHDKETFPMDLFHTATTSNTYDEESDEPWMDETRVQALYTLVRYVFVVLTKI